MINDADPESKQLSRKLALRHLVFFQLKLAMDALRDFALSPISILVFLVDAVRQPSFEDSLYLRLMKLGRRSDQIINLFDEYSDETHYTVDQTFSDVEQTLHKEWRRKEQQRTADTTQGKADSIDPPHKR
jgi:hypothetical protein